MKSRLVRCMASIASLGLAVALGGGCAAFRQSVETVDVDKAKPMDAKYDYSDLRNMSDEMAVELLKADIIQKPTIPPVVAIFSIENRTTIHIDTQAMTDSMRRKLMASGKLKFVNTARRDDLMKEQAYQARNASQESRVAISKQLGAKYMLTGSMVEMTKRSGREVRVSSKEEIYYQLTVELTDLETGIVEVAPQLERARKASKPIIGW